MFGDDRKQRPAAKEILSQGTKTAPRFSCRKWQWQVMLNLNPNMLWLWSLSDTHTFSQNLLCVVAAWPAICSNPQNCIFWHWQYCCSERHGSQSCRLGSLCAVTSIPRLSGRDAYLVLHKAFSEFNALRNASCGCASQIVVGTLAPRILGDCLWWHMPNLSVNLVGEGIDLLIAKFCRKDCQWLRIKNNLPYSEHVVGHAHKHTHTEMDTMCTYIYIYIHITYIYILICIYIYIYCIY